MADEYWPPVPNGPGLGWKSDQRFQRIERQRSVLQPRRFAATGATGFDKVEARQRAFDESARRMQYKHPVRVLKSPTGRFE